MKMKPKYKRLAIITLVLLSIVFGAIFLLKTFEENLIYFYSPTQIIDINNNDPEHALKLFKKKIRVGGMVQKDSIDIKNYDKYTFLITDTSNEIEVTYEGLLPPMFREGQGIVAEGHFAGVEGDTIFFRASKLVTKHDENYMPPEVARAVKKAAKVKEEEN